MQAGFSSAIRALVLKVHFRVDGQTVITSAKSAVLLGVLQAYRHAVAALAHAGTTGAADSPPPQQSQVLVQAAAQALQASLAEEPANGSPLLSDADHLLPIVDALGTGRQAGDTALLKLLAAVAECVPFPPPPPPPPPLLPA